MGSRMETLPSSAAPPTSNSSSINKNTCTHSSPLSTFFVSAPLRSHPPCRRCVMFQASGGHHWSGKLFQDHHRGTGSFYPSQPVSDQVTKILQQIVMESESSQDVEVSANGKENLPSATALTSYQTPLHQLLSVEGLMSVTHGATFPTFLVQSSLRTNPFVLEVVPNPQNEVLFCSDQKVEATCAALVEPPSDENTKSTMPQESNGGQVCKYERVPSGDLLVSCSNKSSLVVEDGGSVRNTSDVVETVGPGPAPSVDDTPSDDTPGGTVTPTCLNYRVEENAGGKNNCSLDDPCSSDEYDSATDEEEEEYDLQESDCDSDDGATGDWNLLPCVEISPPSNNGNADPVEVPCLSLRKLLSEESGYCEGTSSEEGGKAECSGLWCVSETPGDDEVDWDASDDSESEADLNEDLFHSFEMLSPQVCCTSPKVTPPAKVGVTATLSVSLRTPSCATHSIRAERRGNRVGMCIRAPRETPKHDVAATDSAGFESCVMITKYADTCDNEHQAKVRRSHRQPESSSSPSRKSSCQQTKRVRFAEGSSLVMVRQICAWSFAYREARRGPWEQFARDRVHFRRRIDNVALVLEPCLAARRAVGKGLIVDCVNS